MICEVGIIFIFPLLICLSLLYSLILLVCHAFEELRFAILVHHCVVFLLRFCILDPRHSVNLTLDDNCPLVIVPFSVFRVVSFLIL